MIQGFIPANERCASRTPFPCRSGNRFRYTACGDRRRWREYSLWQTVLARRAPCGVWLRHRPSRTPHLSCMASMIFHKRYEFADSPESWRPVNTALDWSGNPLLLMVEGKGDSPNFREDPDAWSRWYRTPPKAHHVVYWDGEAMRTLCLEDSREFHHSTFSVFTMDGYLGNNAEDARLSMTSRADDYVRSISVMPARIFRLLRMGRSG